MVAHVVLAGRLQQAERALHVRLQERLRVRDAVVIVRLRRVMHDRIMTRHDFVEQLRIADVPVHELHTVAQNGLDVLQVACIRQRIQHRDMHVRMVVVHVMNEIRTDKTTTTGHNDIMGSKQFFSHNLQHTVRHTEMASNREKILLLLLNYPIRSSSINRFADAFKRVPVELHRIQFLRRKHIAHT